MLAEKQTKKESGAAMLEMALVAPFFLMLLISVFDISRCINIHSQLVAIAQEGLRAGANVAYLEPNPWRVKPDSILFANPANDIFETNSGTGFVVQAAGIQGPVRILQQMAVILRAKQKELSIENNSWEITSIVDYISAPNKHTVTLKVKYEGFFYLFDGVEIQATAVGPYST
jgi:hypothetical protein